MATRATTTSSWSRRRGSGQPDRRRRGRCLRLQFSIGLDAKRAGRHEGFQSGIDKIDLTGVAPSDIRLSTVFGAIRLTIESISGPMVIDVQGDVVLPSDILAGAPERPTAYRFTAPIIEGW